MRPGIPFLYIRKINYTQRFSSTFKVNFTKFVGIINSFKNKLIMHRDNLARTNLNIKIIIIC